MNDSIRMAKFSLFGADSMPKYQVASRRNKYGIDKGYGLFERQRRNYDLMTSPKENVLGPPAKDPLFILAEDSLLASNVPMASDSLGIDSLQADTIQHIATLEEPVQTGPKYKYRYNPKFSYNHEQEYYNKYFGKLLIDNRPPPQKEIEINLDMLEVNGEEDSLGVEKKRKLVPNFLKKKLKNSEEEPKDDLEEEIIDENEEDEEGGN